MSSPTDWLPSTAKYSAVIWGSFHMAASWRFSDLPSNANEFPLFHEVFVITQFWGDQVFHRMIEILPRLAFYLDFLKRHPNIRIISTEKAGGQLGEYLKILGLDPRRIRLGWCRANIVYLPRPTVCGIVNLHEIQLLSQRFRTHIERSFPLEKRNRLILIRRSETRRFTEQVEIEKSRPEGSQGSQPHVHTIPRRSSSFVELYHEDLQGRYHGSRSTRSRIIEYRIFRSWNLRCRRSVQSISFEFMFLQTGPCAWPQMARNSIQWRMRTSHQRTCLEYWIYSSTILEIHLVINIHRHAWSNLVV